VYLGVHPSSFLAFELSQSKKSTSAGLKYFGFTSTKQVQVFLLYHFSSIQVHFHSISIPASKNDQFTKSLTL
jgi:hypothetical protein